MRPQGLTRLQRDALHDLARADRPLFGCLVGSGNCHSTLSAMAKRGWVERLGPKGGSQWRITDAGRQELGTTGRAR